MRTKLKIISSLALRNLLAHRIHLLTGGLVFAGTLLLLVGGSVVASVDEGMRRSITGSVAGDLHLQASDSKEEVSIFGGMGGDPDLVSIRDFPRVKAALLGLENVKAVVPMGVNGSMFTPGTSLDLALAKTRDLLRSSEAEQAAAAWVTEYDRAQRRVRYMVGQLDGYLEKGAAYVSPELFAQDQAHLARAQSEAFWQGFAEDPLDSLEFLENKVAPLMGDAPSAEVRFLGTDLKTFGEVFQGVELVKGQDIPEGQRGLLFGDYYYEEYMKLQTARRLDKIQRARKDGTSIAEDSDLQAFVAQNQSQVGELLLQLDPEAAARVAEKLRAALDLPGAELAPLLAELLTTSDANFDQRYALFYDVVAPHLSLYRVRVGDVLQVTAHTRTGYIASAAMRVYGTYQFKGLEDSRLVGLLSLVDLVTFGELYGYTTPDQDAELQSLRDEAGIELLSREEAEGSLFTASTPVRLHESMDIGVTLDRVELARAREALMTQVYSQDQLESGVVLSAAVVLHDPGELDRTLEQIRRLDVDEGLGIKVLTWRQAAGLIGQFTAIAKLVLYFCALMVVVVTAIVISNVVTTATLRRIREFGTLRAMGAQRPLLMSTVLAESVAVGLVFATLGAIAGVGVLLWLGQVGIPGGGDLSLFFSGPRLYPQVSAGAMAVAYGVTVVVSVLASLFPALLASRVTPLVAMQTED